MNQQDATKFKFGRVVAKIRKSKKMKQKQLAAMSAVPVTLLSRIENGKRLPSAKHMMSIASALDIPHEILMILSLDIDKVPIAHKATFESYILAVQSEYDISI